MNIYGEIVNDLTSPGVGFRMTQAGSEESTILDNLASAGVVWEAQGEGNCKVYFREYRAAIRSNPVGIRWDDVSLHP